ncbi:glycosyltransferase family 2 protein, partial [Candidatus Pacearchaeota archaeon]|nr:glycosyltransferase family 2 protein [Candidatus Pacearchaeota archaeon]
MNDSSEICETDCIDNERPSIDVSIIIVSWNTRDILRDCLASVYAQTCDILFEILVIDNASGDGSVEMVRRQFPKATVVANSPNVGFATANNQGLNAAKGRYILLLNSDTVILDKAIQKTVTFADSHLDAAVVGCRVLNIDRTLQQTCFKYPSLLNLVLSLMYLNKLFPRNRFFGREEMTWWDRRDAREVDVVSGCFMLVQRGAINDVGL